MHLPSHSCMCSHIYLASIQAALSVCDLWCCWHVPCRCECRKLGAIIAGQVWCPEEPVGPSSQDCDSQASGQLVERLLSLISDDPVTRGLEGTLGKSILNKLPG